MADVVQPPAGNGSGSGGASAAAARPSFSDVVRAHWHWDVELPDADADASELTDARSHFERVLAEFERTEVRRGWLADNYWCRRAASGVALAVIPTNGNGLRRLPQWLRLWYPVPQYRIYRHTDWVTVEYPQLANLLHECDVLAVKAEWGLEGIYQAVVLPWLMSVEKHVLGFIENEGSREKRRQSAIESEDRRTDAEVPAPPAPAASETRAALARRQREEKERERAAAARIEGFRSEVQHELSRIEDYYQRAGEKQARLHYVTGMLVFGILIVVLAGLVSAGSLAIFGLLAPHHWGVRRFYACMAAGAVGAIVSVLIRMGGRRGGFNIDHELGSSGVRRLGAFRPIIGAICGVAIALLLTTTLVPIKHSALTVHFYVVVAFLAGFSERWTKVVLDGAMRTVQKFDGDPQQATSDKGIRSKA
jgi:hypothetical protein